MIKALIAADGDPSFVSFVNGPAIYLDNFAVISLAKSEQELRKRLIAALRSGAELLFSIMNAVELVGPQGASSIAVKAFLDEVGPNWFPLEMELQTVLDREQKGNDYGTCCFCNEMIRSYFQARTSEDVPGSGRVIDLSSENFFRLGMFADWLAPRREWLRAKRGEFDAILLEGVRNCRAKYKQNPTWLNIALPQKLFDRRRPATFAHNNLIRNLIATKGDQLKQGDGIDFFHAVMASAYANFAALDKQWKHRVENLPKPNGLARIYYRPQLREMITDIETTLSQRAAPR